MTKIQYLAADKTTPAACADGYATAEYVNNEYGKPIQTFYYDEDGEPYVMAKGYDQVRNTWDENNKIYENYWLDGKPVFCSDGYHGIKYDYNGVGKKVRGILRYRGASGALQQGIRDHYL